MGQRRAASDAYQFDLVPDDGPDSGAPEPPGSGVGPPTLLDRVRAWPRRRVVAGVVAAAVVLGGGGVASALVERQRVDALRGAVGGVVDLSRAPTETWSVATPNGSPLTMLGDLVVVSTYTFGDEGSDVDGSQEASELQLRAIDPADGTEAWRRTFVGERWNCGPSPRYAELRLVVGTSDSVVCVNGGPEATVQVIDEAGDVLAERRLEGTDVRVPAADGGLVRLEHVGEPGPLPRVLGDETTGYRLSGPVIAPDLHVTMEDAATGAVRWEATVDSLPTGRDNWYPCSSYGEGGAGPPKLDPTGGNYFHWADDSVIVLGACGIDAAFTPSGTRLDVPSGPPGVSSAEGMGGSYEMVMRTDDDYYLRPAEVDEHGQYSGSPDAPWDVLDADGVPLVTLPGQPPEALATDGSRPGIVLSYVVSGLAAIRVSDGETLWEETIPVPLALIARTRDQALVMSADHELISLDLSSGERRWTAKLEPVDGVMWGDASSSVRGAFTDGRVAVLVTPGLGMPGDVRLTAYHLGSGDVVWTSVLEDAVEGYGITVDGRMLYWDFTTLTGLG